MHSTLRTMRPDRVFGWGGSILGLTLSAFNLIHVNEYLLTMGPMLTVMCMVHLRASRNEIPLSGVVVADSEARLRRLVLMCLLLCDGALLAFLSAMESRTLPFFLLYATTSGLTASAVVVRLSDDKTTIAFLCAQIILLGVVIRASSYFLMEGIPGIDSSYHAALIAEYVESGHVPLFFSKLADFNYYHSLPLSHTFCAAAQLIAGTGTKTALFLAWSVPQVLGSLVVFLIGRKLFNASVGLLAMLLAVTADYQIMWGAANPIAMTYGLALFATLLLVTLGIAKQASTTTLALVLTVAIVVTHTVTYFIAVVLLAALCVARPLYRILYNKTSSESSVISLAGLFTLTILVFVHSNFLYTMPSQASFFDRQFAYWAGSIETEAAFLNRGIEGVQRAGIAPAILNISGQLVLLGLGVLGCLLIAQPKDTTPMRFSLIPTLVIMVALPLSFPLFGLANIQPTRWPAFYYLLLAIPASLAVNVYMSRFLGVTRAGAAVFLLVACTSFLMATNSTGNPDSPLYAEGVNEPTVYSRAERAVALYIERAEVRAVLDGRLSGHLRNSYELDVSLSSRMLSPGDGPYLLLWRERLTGRPAKVMLVHDGVVTSSLMRLPYDFLERQVEEHHTLYANLGVTVFFASASQ